MADFIDTHCHLDCSPLVERLPEVLAAAGRVGVCRYIVPGIDAAGWERIAALAQDRAIIHAAFGLHPMHALNYGDETLIELERFTRQATAIGEIGLDYALQLIPREAQKESFRAQLRMAVRVGLPVMIHCRRAFGDLLTILREERVERVGGVMHAFSGSPEIAAECVRLGLMISVSGTVTYGNAVRPVEVARRVSLEHLVLETDAPDMTPDPYRGRPNEPAFLLETAKKVAVIKGVSLEEVAAVTTINAERIFNLKKQ